MPVKRLLLLLATLLAALQASATLPTPFTAWYTVHAKGFTLGTMERRLEHRGKGRYRFRSESQSTGLVALIRSDQVLEKSIWILENNQIRPVKYVYRHTGSKDRTIKIRFDWIQGRIIEQKGENTRSMAIVPGVLDKLVYQLGIMWDLRRGERRFEYRIADDGKIKTYHFVNLGEEAVTTPLGQFQAIKLEYQKADSPRKTTLWCAPTLGYLPVRMDYTEKDGTVFSALLKKTDMMPAR